MVRIPLPSSAATNRAPQRWWPGAAEPCWAIGLGMGLGMAMGMGLAMGVGKRRRAGAPFVRNLLSRQALMTVNRTWGSEHSVRLCYEHLTS